MHSLIFIYEKERMIGMSEVEKTIDVYYDMDIAQICKV